MHELTITPDLQLLAPSIEHADRLFEVIQANRAHLSPWMGWISHVKQRTDTANYLREASNKLASGDAINLLIAFKSQIVGTVSLEKFNKANQSAELGYWLDYNSQGQSLVTQSAKALINHGFATCGLNRIMARCAVQNDKSRQVIERLGFLREGVLRQSERVGDTYYDQFIYGLLRSD